MASGLASGNKPTGVVDLDSSQTMENKTLDSSNIIDGSSVQAPSRLDVKKDTQANLETYAASASDGQLCFATDTKQMYQVVDNALVDVGSGAGGINYIENSDFEIDASGYVGDTNFTVSRTTASPLRGSGSGLLSKAAVNAQDETIKVPFTIDAADNSQKLYIEFDKEISADHADGDVRVEIVKDPNGTPETIRCNGEDIQGTSGKHLAWFQADASVVEYELVFKVVTTNASAYTIKIDNVQVGPRDATYVSSPELLVSGAGNAAQALTANVTDIPYIQTLDKLDSWDGDSFTAPHKGTYSIFGNVRFSSAIDPLIGAYVDGTQVDTLNSNIGTAQSHHISGVVELEKGEVLTFRSNTSATLQNLSALHTINITGPNPTRVSEDIGNREVRVRGAGNGGTSITGTTDVPFTEIEDTSASWDGDTFTAPETGDYAVSGSVYLSSSAVAGIYAAIDGTREQILGFNGTSSQIHPFSGTVALEKGQVFSLRASGGTAVSNNADFHHIHIQKLAQPQTILETETVAARYTSDSGQAISTAGTIIKYENKVFDTHNAYDISTGILTIPVTGYYTFGWAAYYPSALSSVNADIQVDGTTVANCSDRDGGTGTSGLNPKGSIVLYLEKGQEVSIRGDANSNTNITANSIYNYFSYGRLK